MGASAPPNATSIRGAACKALTNISAKRADMEALLAALDAIEPAGYAGLESVLGKHLLTHGFNATEIAQIVKHLGECWFNAASPKYYFPGTPNTAKIYGQGLSQTLTASLAVNTPAPLPIEARWYLGHSKVDMLNIATERQVTLVIATPRPVEHPELA